MRCRRPSASLPGRIGQCVPDQVRAPGTNPMRKFRRARRGRHDGTPAAGPGLPRPSTKASPWHSVQSAKTARGAIFLARREISAWSESFNIQATHSMSYTATGMKTSALSRRRFHPVHLRTNRYFVILNQLLHAGIFFRILRGGETNRLLTPLPAASRARNRQTQLHLNPTSPFGFKGISDGEKSCCG
jgi:hypothetical protein